MRLTAKLWLLL